MADVLEVFSVEEVKGDESEVALFKWAIKCHQRRFFGEYTGPEYPLQHLLPVELALSNVDTLVYLLRYFPEVIKPELRKIENIPQFVKTLIFGIKDDPYTTGFVLSPFKLDVIDRNFLMRQRLSENVQLFEFFEGAISGRSFKLLEDMNEKCVYVVLKPDDMDLSLVHLTLQKKKCFVDIDLCSFVFSSFSVMKFLMDVQMLSVGQIDDRVRSLPSHPLSNRFKCQISLCRSLGDIYLWNSLSRNSVPKLISSVNVAKDILATLTENSKFLDIFDVSWRADYSFIRSFVVLSDFITGTNTDIPEDSLVDCFSALFLRTKGNKYAFSFRDALKRIEKLKACTPEIHVIYPYVIRAYEKFKLVEDMCQSPTFEDTFLTFQEMIFNLIENRETVPSISLKNRTVRMIAASASFQSVIQSKYSARSVTDKKIDNVLATFHQEYRNVCLLDFYASYREAFYLSLGGDGVESRFASARRKAGPKLPVEIEINTNANVARFKKHMNSILETLPDTYITKEFISRIVNYAEWVSKFQKKSYMASDLLVADHKAILKQQLSSARSISDVSECAAQIGVDICDLIFQDIEFSMLPECIYDELRTTYPLTMFMDKHMREVIVSKSQVLWNWNHKKIHDMRAYSVPNSKESFNIFMKERSIFNIDTSLESLTTWLPLLLDSLLSKPVLTEEDCDLFEDIMFQFDLSGNWSSIAEICTKIEEQFNRPMLELFSALTPLVGKEMLEVFEVTAAETSLIDNVRSIKTDSDMIRSNPGLIMHVLKDRNLIYECPGIVARLCNLHLTYHGPNFFVNRVLKCMKMRLHFPDNSVYMKAASHTFDPEMMIQVAIRACGFSFSADVAKMLQISCLKLVKEHNFRPEFLVFVNDDAELDRIICGILSAVTVDSKELPNKYLMQLCKLRRHIRQGTRSFCMYKALESILVVAHSGFSMSDLQAVYEMCFRNDIRTALPFLVELGVKERSCCDFRFVENSLVDGQTAVFSTPDISEDDVVHEFVAANNHVPIYLITKNNSVYKIYRNRPKEPVTGTTPIEELPSLLS